jgi:gliding motility-associated-like protein
VKSPCYNFTNLKYPTIGVRVYWESEFNLDGTVLQFSTDNGITWQNAGSYSDPKNCLNMNWYNTSSIQSLGNSEGWSGSSTAGGSGCSTGNGSNGWVLASKTMPSLAGKPNVQFRFIFGSGPGCNSYNGFAFDDFTVGEALPNIASFYFSCTSANTVKFTNASFLCPTVSWDFGDPGSGPSNVSSAAAPTHTFSTTGQFTVTLTATGPDNAPSTVKKVITILDLKTQVTNEPLCNGDKNGSVSVTAFPALAGLNYSWNSVPAQNSPSAVNLGAGTWIVSVSGTNICTATGSITLSEPPVLKNIVSVNQPSCKNNDGTISLASSGGTAAYSYSWTPAISSANTASGLQQGSYSILVKDKNLCQQTENITLTAPAPIFANITASKDASCYGFTDGSATVSVSGAPGPYTFSWMPSGGNNATATGLAKNNYTVTVTDNNKCVATATTVINEPPALNAIISSTDATCANNNGTASVNVSGGTVPYSYLWIPTNEATAAISGLSPQVYSLTVSDKNGCRLSQPVTINSSGTTLGISIGQTDIPCFGEATGSATATVTGGKAPYLISWSNGATGPAVSGLKKGTYTVTAKDALGCSKTATVNILEPAAALSVALVPFDALCDRGNGKVTSIVTGGTPGYTYAWSNGASTSQIILVPSGAYSLVVSDKNGCKANATTTVKAPAPLAIGMVVNPATCGLNNGSATASVSGGTSPYSYAWPPGNFATPAVTNLAPGNYDLAVTDKNGCIQNAQATILGSSAPGLQVSKTDVSCQGDATGSATVTITGGKAPYSISWSNGSAGSTADNLKKGVYTVNVKDALGCSNSMQVTIMEPSSPLAISLAPTQQLCNNGNGSVTSIVSGGTAPYSFNWSDGASTQNLVSVPGGSYALAVADKNGCKANATITLIIPAPIAIAMVVNPATCGLNNGSATASVSGGTSPYSYTWSPGNNTSPTITNLAAGNYDLAVTDKNGCIQNAIANILGSSAPGLQVSHTDVRCHGDATGSATVTITGGKAPYSISWSNGTTGATALNLKKGIYTVNVKDAVGCSNSMQVTIIEPSSPLAISLAPTQPLCNNGNGSVTSLVSGGTTPYSFKWSSGATTQNLVSVPAGSYSLEVADINGCKAMAATLVKDAEAIDIQFSSVQAASCGASNGFIKSLVTGGSTPYSYQWKPGGETTNDLLNLPPGNYTLTITDKNGCSTSKEANVPATGNFLVKATPTNIICNGDKNGTASVLISGGIPPYSIAWSTGETTPSIKNLPAGNYSVMVKDGSGCSIGAIFSLSEPPALSLNLRVQSATCTGSTGGITSVVNGDGPFLYNWQPGNISSPNLPNLTAGNYSLTVTDKNGCNKSATAVVSTTNSLTISLGKDTVICGTSGFDLSPGSFESYAWQNGSANPVFRVTGEGYYWVTVKDRSGCVATDTIKVVSGCGEIWFPTAFTPNGDGKNEEFGPLGNLAQISNFSMTIFDRWGLKVFESYNPAVKWNGQYRGNAPGGNYAWFARYKNRTGLMEMRKGNIVLVR